MRNYNLLTGIVTAGLSLTGCTKMAFEQDPHHESLRVAGGVKIEKPAPLTVDREGLLVSGTCTTGYKVEIAGPGMGSISNSKLDCIDGTFSTYVKFSNSDGKKNITAAQALASTGQWAQDERDFLKDTTAPAILISSPANRSEVQSSITVSGQCETGLAVSLYLTGQGAIGQTSCVGGAFSFPYNLPGIDGTKNIVAQQIDIAGNQGSDNKDVIKDTVAPRVTISSPNVNTVHRGSVQLVGTCETGLEVSIEGSGITSSQKTACSNGQFTLPIELSSGDGAKVVTAVQIDRAGNRGQDSRNYIKDATGPIIKITNPVAGTITRGPVQVSGTCETGLSVVISGAVAATVSCSNGQFAFSANLTGADGVKQIIAAQADAAGNTGSDQQTIELDNTAPQIAITAPAANSVAATGITLNGTCETGIEVSVSGAGVNVVTRGSCVNSSFSIPIVFSANDGVKAITATQIDRAGNTGSASRSFNRDSTAPIVSITSPAPNTETNSGIRLQGTCETGINVSISGAGVSQPYTAACASGRFDVNIVLSSGDGVKPVIASQRDDVGNTTQDQRNFIKDTIAPVVKISLPEANSSVKNQITLIGTCENGLVVNIAGSGVASTTNTSCANGAFNQSIILSNGDGRKDISVSQTDNAGNIGTDTRSFSKDTTGPQIVILSPAVNTTSKTGITLTGTCESGLEVTISGLGVESNTNTTCSSGNFSSAVIFSSADGVKNIIASQTDAAGNIGSDNRNFIKDSVSPIVAITSPQANSNIKSGFTLAGTCESGLQVSLTGSITNTTTACTGGQFSANLTLVAGDGVKNIIASQTDAAGNTGTDNRNFIADNLAPVVAITSPVNGSFVANGANIVGTCEVGLGVNISGSGLSSVVNATCVNGNFTGQVNFTVGDGDKTVIASQTDSAGNTGSDSKTYKVDSGVPVVTIETPSANTSAQNGVTIGGACETGVSVIVSGTGVSTPSNVSCVGGRYTASIIFSNNDGTKNVVVSQTDSAGNTGSTNRDFIKDTVSPVVTITTPVANANLGRNITVTGTCESGISVVVSGDVSSSTTVTCANNQYTANVVAASGDGVKSIVVRQTDAAGNVGTDTRQYNVDTTMPVVRITSPIEGAVVLSTSNLTGTCESGIDVRLSGAGLSSAVNVQCSNGAFSSNVSFSGGDGNKVVTATQTDLVGNIGSDTKTYRLDTGAPIVTIDTPAAGTTSRSGLTLGGTCETGLVVNLSGTGLSTPSTTTCANSRYSVAIVFSSGDGVKNIIVSQTDAAGNTGSANRDFASDSVSPVITITSPAANSNLGSTFVVSGNCEIGLPVNLTGNITAANTSCTNGQFSATVVASSGDGVKSITARQTDIAGNVGSDTKQYNVDTIAPIVRITAPAANSNAQTGLELRGTCESGIEVVIYGTGIEGTVRTPCQNSSFVSNINFSIGEGAKVVNVSQTDATGNMGTDSRTFQKDVTAPALSFTAPAEGSFVKTLGVTLQGTCETGLTVNLTGGGLAANATTSCAAGRFSLATNLSSGDGDKNIIAYQTDAAGNNGSAILNLVVDATAPVVAITAPSANSTFKDGLQLIGTCESGIDLVVSGAGVANNITQVCTNGTFNVAVQFSAGDGAKLISVSQTDRAGNVGSDSRSFNRLTAIPVVKITAPPAGTRDQNGVTLQGTCTNGLGIVVAGDISSNMTTTCTNGQFSQAVVFSANDGLKTVIVTQTNAAGDVGRDQRDFVKGVVNGYEVFNVSLSNPRVDILFVDDNSSSMEAEQLKLANRFSSFISGLNGVDWQIGITTTDCSTGPYGICGSLLNLTGVNGKILTNSTPNYERVFADTIYRPETVGCQARGDCPSSNEKALVSSMTAMDKRSTDNNGFFRQEADLAVVVLSDEDEMSNAPPSATKPDQAQAHFKSIWPSNKKLSVYGIIIQPGDKTCLDAQVNQGGGFAFYGTYVDQWSRLTGGVTGSICNTDYSATLETIGRQVRTISDSVELSRTPIAGSVRVVFTPSQNITWTVQGNRVLFNAPPPVGTRIEVYYDYQ